MGLVCASGPSNGWSMLLIRRANKFGTIPYVAALGRCRAEAADALAKAFGINLSQALDDAHKRPLRSRPCNRSPAPHIFPGRPLAQYTPR